MTQQLIDRIDSGDCIAIIWDIEDVKGRADERNMKISNKKAREILAAIERHHGCEIGVTWDTIDAALDEI